MDEELSYSPSFSRPVAHFPERANEEAASSTRINILSGSHDDANDRVGYGFTNRARFGSVSMRKCELKQNVLDPACPNYLILESNFPPPYECLLPAHFLAVRPSVQFDPST